MTDMVPYVIDNPLHSKPPIISPQVKSKTFLEYFSTPRNKLIVNLSIYIIFSLIYTALKDDFDHSIESTRGPLSSTDDQLSIWYFSLITHTTVGFGDIIPKTRRVKAAISIHVLLSFIVNLIL